MPDLQQTVNLPAFTAGWAGPFLTAWRLMIQTLNALSRVDTTANKPSTPALDHIFFTESDTHRTFVAVDGAWKHIERLDGTAGGAFNFVELAGDPAAPAANEALLYTRDNGAGKTQLVVRFNTGAIQVIATEP